MDSARDKGSEATKYRLAKAMEECMRTQSVEAVTVTNIAEKCGVTRQTFYRNFLDKYDLINWYFGCSRAPLSTWAAAGPSPGARAQVQYIRQERVFFTAAFRADGTNSLKEHDFRGHRLLHLDVIQKKTGAAPTEDERFALELYCRGSVAMTVKWVLGGMREAPREMSRRLVAALPEQLSELFARLSFL